MRHILASTLAACVAVAGFAAPALAHPKIVSANPAEGSTAAAKVTQISITFNEPLMAAMSGMDVVMTGMPGMTNHEPMKMTGVKTALAADKVTLVAKLPRALPAGTYEANWHVVSTDTHRVAGKLNFTVK
ncbi:copper homeostasis periplasmic binding protein CopC [Novosphingobium humi]|uniref:Copper homeostasis periplasmic binding protein CopC n=1 Tax=Novosphingobium humi TaxID=2282397 RepID=A0ABY7TSL7_9SPHN|nr:copper homeostasis periplasmic binding protein CopC [Novosphingobium humi]WCT76192.1 copper homeostasis periplasmic binding protein CopC [Novosphingobium humi]WJS97346.1 copper homeostasis periplasmic binding protein CopC [Novosphingobium humi]